jgi:F-type H+-transporting ATPase subunit delta
MSRNPVSRSYGRAIFEASQEADCLPLLKEELEVLSTVLKTELAQVLVSPSIAVAIRLSVITEIFQGASPLFLSFLELVIRKGRAAELKGMIAEFEKLADEAKGVARGVLTTVHPLSETLRAELTDYVASRLNSKVELSVSQDPRILGGFQVRVGDRLLDASVKARLEGLRRSMLAG